MEIYGNLYIEASIHLHLSKIRLFTREIILFITASGKVIKASARCAQVPSLITKVVLRACRPSACRPSVFQAGLMLLSFHRHTNR